jgi:ribosomal protein S6--L-glutamate ligase
MLIFTLSRNESLYSTQRIVETAERRGHDVFVRDPLAFTIQVQNPPDLLYQSKPITLPNAVIPRIGASITHFGIAVVRQFEQMGVFTLNPSVGIADSRDKLRALQILSKHDVPLPKTVFVRKKREILRAIEEIGGVPVVIKLLEGTQGMGVVLAQDLNTAQAIIELLQVAKQNILVQRFVAEAKGRDIRAFVIGDRVIAAMRRVAGNHDEFRANIHQGGRAEKIELSPETCALAVKSAHLLGLRVAGVDLLEGNKGPLVIEVNSSPGLEGIEKASGVDVAEEIIRYIEHRVERDGS